MLMFQKAGALPGCAIAIETQGLLYGCDSDHVSSRKKKRPAPLRGTGYIVILLRL